MSKINTILILSSLVFLLPFLGFPQAFDNFLYVVFGITIFISGYLLKKDSNDKEIKPRNGSGWGPDEA